MEVDARSVIIWVMSILTGSFSFVLLMSCKTLSARLFSLCSLFFSLWSTTMGFLIATKSPELGFFLPSFCYFLGTIIASFFYCFFFSFTKEESIPFGTIKILLLAESIFFILYFFTDLMIGNFVFNKELGFWTWEVKPLSIIFDLYFYSVFIFGVHNLYLRYKSVRDTNDKSNLKYMILTIIVGTFPPAIFNIAPHWFGIFKYNWVGPSTGIFWVMILGYSILKYQQMDVKLAFSQVSVLALNFIFFTNIFLNFQLGVYGRTTLAILFCTTGYFLIKLIIKDNERAEVLRRLNGELNNLNSGLEEKVKAQTVEIRRVYEIEKKANENLKKLDQNKNDFIIVTQHHLRTPLSQIRWYLDSIKNGLYGPVTGDISGAVENISKVTDKLTKVLNHFLDISQLKVGNKIFNMEIVNSKDLIDAVIYELRLDLKKKGMFVEFESKDWPELNCDPEKIKDVFQIILDNAVKYGTEGSTITISVLSKKSSVMFKMKNSGLPLESKDLASIFKDSFYRSAEAKKLNPLGMGVSLLVAKTIMSAHRGVISLTAINEGGVEATLEFKL